jgi:hypothetical protein
MMLTIRGVYNGKTFSPLHNEPVPQVQEEVPVAIVFLKEVSPEANGREREREAARRMRAARDAMTPLGTSVKDLIEAGRER